MRRTLRNLTTRILVTGPILAAFSCMKEDATEPTAEPDLAASATAVQPKVAFLRRMTTARFDVFVMNADGTGQRRLTFGERNEFPVLSPNGQQILYTECQEMDNPLLMLINADGTNRRSFARSFSCGVEAEIPAWSPDGSRIAYVNFDGYLFVNNADGTGRRKLTTKEVTEYAPAWSPDGRRIAYEDLFNVHLINADGTQPRQLTHEPGPTQPMPAWSPNSGSIVFVSRRDGNFEIYRMKADGTNQIRLTRASDACSTSATLCGDRYPSWSPDGRKIAFTSDRDGNDEIYVMNPDGSGQKRLTRSPGADVKPKWSPDGTRIFFTTNRYGNADVFSMNPDGTGQANISRNSRDDVHPSVSR
jgi:Tol biopolymer transport system component